MLHLVRTLADSPIWLGLCGFGVIVVPMFGLQYIYEQERRKGG